MPFKNHILYLNHKSFEPCYWLVLFEFMFIALHFQMSADKMSDFLDPNLSRLINQLIGDDYEEATLEALKVYFKYNLKICNYMVIMI